MSLDGIPCLVLDAHRAHQARKLRLDRVANANRELKIRFANESKKAFAAWIVEQNAIRDAHIAAMQKSADMLPWSIMSRLTELAKIIAHRENIPAREILSVRRRAPSTRARHEIMWTIRNEFPGASLPKIALIMGRACGKPHGFDHTSALHGIRKHQARLDAAKAVLDD